MKTIKLENWQLQFDGRTIPANVPGDITIDLYNAGIVKNPYFGDNQKENEWIPRKDFTYIAEVWTNKEILANESVQLVFKGVDVYSDIYLNDQLLGCTENMFLEYRFPVQGLLKEGKNELRVEMKSTLNKMDTLDATGYYSIFNSKRLLVRKAQCHFGWDWAPKICAYGIWQEVYMEYGAKECIDNVYVIADEKGTATLFTQLNYNVLDESDEQTDFLHYYVSKTPTATEYIKKTIPVIGVKSFVCFHIEDAQLWWPIGYGEHPLYNYKVELERNGKIIHTQEGRFAFRSVELVEDSKGDFLLGYALKINGKEIFVRGSNWVPIECFTGVVNDEKYDRLTDLAKNGNFNMLRVWGGGIYEKDIFYHLCDEKGILVWQDIMLACSDIPEDKPEWVNNIVKEIEYQVKRLSMKIFCFLMQNRQRN